MNAVEFFEHMAKTAEMIRRQEQEMDVDMTLSDGTVIRRKGDSAETLASLDKVISFAKERSNHLSSRTCSS